MDSLETEGRKPVERVRSTRSEETVVVVDGVDEGYMEAFSLEEFSHLKHRVDVSLSRVRHADYMWFLCGVDSMRGHFCFVSNLL